MLFLLVFFYFCSFKIFNVMYNSFSFSIDRFTLSQFPKNGFLCFYFNYGFFKFFYSNYPSVDHHVSSFSIVDLINHCTLDGVFFHLDSNNLLSL